MEITKRSPFSGEMHTIDVPCTHDQLEAWKEGMLIQNAMPNVSAELREFIITGITPDEWNSTFGKG